MSYKQLAKKILKMWIDQPKKIPLVDFIAQYCEGSHIKDPEKLKQFVLFLCDPSTVKAIEKKLGIEKPVGIPPMCCHCGTMDPQSVAKTDSGEKVYWIRIDDHNSITKTCEDNPLDFSSYFVAILDKMFIWDGTYNIVCVDCAFEMFDQIGNDMDNMEEPEDPCEF